MPTHRAWSQYAPDYRTADVQYLAGWLQHGRSGCVVGLPGSGKSNLLGYLCYRPDIIQAVTGTAAYQLALIPIDLNNFPDHTPATFYRVILRAFFEMQAQFDPTARQNIITLYHEHKAVQDPFLVQSALRDLLILLQNKQQRLVFVFDRFDDFCAIATPTMINALRGLRDSFKDTLSYIMGMRQEAAYLPDGAALGELYEIVDSHVYWLGPLNTADSHHLINIETRAVPTAPSGDEMQLMSHLSGGNPALLKAITHWWNHTAASPPADQWTDTLLNQPSIRYRLEELISGLTQEEMSALSALQKERVAVGETAASRTAANQRQATLRRLTQKGICQTAENSWRIQSALLAAAINQLAGRSRGRLWQDNTTSLIYQGETPLPELPPLERELLAYLLQNPYTRHTKTDLIVGAWPDELRQHSVTDDSLYQVVAGIRKKVEPAAGKPVYLINWRGKPEGGYQLYPEGRPRVQ